MSSATCSTCPWFAADLQTSFRGNCGAAKYHGSCRIDAPAAAGWPRTWEDDWCGKHPQRQTCSRGVAKAIDNR